MYICRLLGLVIWVALSVKHGVGLRFLSHAGLLPPRLQLAYCEQELYQTSILSLHMSIDKVEYDKSFDEHHPSIYPGNSNAGSSLQSSAFSLTKTIVGTGILSLPACVARGFSDKRTALYPASLILLVMGMLAGYTFQSIGRACQRTGTRTLTQAWAKIIGPRSAKLIGWMVVLKTFLACLAYSILIGDTFSHIFHTFGLPAMLTSRTNVIIGMMSLLVFPLCCLKNLNALQYTSILGLAGVAYTAGFMSLRHMEGSYQPKGRFFDGISPLMQPSFDQTLPEPRYMVFSMMANMITAYVAHFNAPRFFTELRNPTMRRFGLLTLLGFSSATLVYLLVMTVGFLTFGGSSAGCILNNYADTDLLATMARVAIGLGIVTGYPLTFTALRDALFDVAHIDGAVQRERYSVPLTAGALGVITTLALKLTNLGAVARFSGALIGSGLVYLIPAILNIQSIHLDAKHSAGYPAVPVPADNEAAEDGLRNNNRNYTVMQRIEIAGNRAIAIMATLTACIGVSISVKGLK